MPYRDASRAASFLQSALTPDGRFLSLDDWQAWCDEYAARHHFAVRRIPFSQLDQWSFLPGPRRLAHRSGHFFTIEGLRVRTEHGPVKRWDQPIIHQPEIGILGIVTRVVDGLRYFLMQAKMEPGNVNLLQLSPTVQATWSNYTRVHEGSRPAYLEYFLDRSRSRILVDQLQTEQGSRFFRKRNRNIVVEVDDDVALVDGFCWLTLGQIQRLLAIDNAVNMDARSVLSCIPRIDPSWRHRPPDDLRQAPDRVTFGGHRLAGFGAELLRSMASPRPAHDDHEVSSWLTELKTTRRLSTERIALDDLEHWVESETEIRHESGQHFAVIAVDVEAGTREVVRWTQPLLEHFGHGLVGFLTQKIAGTLHFLVRASLEPGNRDLVEIGPTVSCANPEARSGTPAAPRFLDAFLGAAPEAVRYRAVQSEEGGRFYHFQNRYVVVELPPEERLEIPEDFLWMTLGQISDLLPHGYFNIEARSLISCLDLLAPEPSG